METTSEYTEKAERAIRRFVERRGMELLDGTELATAKLVYRDGEDLAFAAINVTAGAEDGFDGELPDRASMERDAMAWLMAHPEDTDLKVRFDLFSIIVLGEDRAFLRLHADCLSQSASED